MDPRVDTSQAGLRAQFAVASRITALMQESYNGAKRDKRYAALNERLSALLDVVEAADMWPTPRTTQAVDAVERQMRGKM